MEQGVAIARSNGYKTQIFRQGPYEKREDFTMRVIMAFDVIINSRNTLTVEFVWDE